MKRWFIAALVVAAGCSKSSSNNDPNACTRAENGAARCASDVVDLLEVCDGSHYVSTQNCASTSQVCLASGTTAQCVTPGQAGDTCDTVSPCASTLTCAMTSGNTQGTCIEDCALSATNAYTCQDTSLVCAANIDATVGVCVAPSAGLGDMCFDDVQYPYDPAHPSRCHWFRDGTYQGVQVAIGACGDDCGYSEIGKGQGSCPSGLVCLESPYRLDVQRDPSGNYIPCTGDSTCYGGGGYTCIAVNSRLSVCARSYGVCGHALPLYATVPDTTLATFDVHVLCGVAYADQTDLRNFCGMTDPQATARPYCQPVFSDDLYAGLCVASCQTSGECGAGYVCQAPTPVADAVLIDVQRDSLGNGVKCGASGTGTCTGKYACEGFAPANGGAAVYYCAYAPTVCTPAP